MNNLKRYILKSVSYNIVLLFITGGIIQNFFSYLGFSSSQIGTYISMTNVAQIVVMILGIVFVDRISNPKKTCSVLVLNSIAFCLAMLFFCFFKGIPTNIIFISAMIFGAFVSLLNGFESILAYRLPYQVIDMHEFEKGQNLTGIVGGIISVVITSLISVFSTVIDFSYIIAVGFTVSLIFCIVASVTCKRMTEIKKIPKSDKFKLSKLKKRVFLYFYFPNFIRGCATAIVMMMPVIFVSEITDNPAKLSAMNIAYAIAGIVSSVIYRAIGNRLRSKTVFLIGAVITFVSLPMAVVGKSSIIFFIFYLFGGMGNTMLSVASAIYATEIVGADDIGAFSSLKMIFLLAGQAVSSFVIGKVIGKIPVFVLILVFVSFMLLSGILHYVYKPSKAE